jgi:S-formylglutathione hydrolase FrmB
MHLATMQFYSPALQRHVTYTVILPEEQQGPAPVLLQLHGYTDDHTAWVTSSNLVRHARPYPFIIVLPDGATSFWADANDRMRYETFVMEDLWRHVTRTFQAQEGPWAVGGLSMGGFGALRFACKYPDRFASVWGHSSAFFDRRGLFPKLEDPAEMDMLALTRRLAASPVRPVISFDCGTEDELLDGNRRLHDHLNALGIDHAYQEHPGAHTWAYWDEHVQAALKQYARVLVRQ